MCAAGLTTISPGVLPTFTVANRVTAFRGVDANNMAAITATRIDQCEFESSLTLGAANLGWHTLPTVLLQRTDIVISFFGSSEKKLAPVLKLTASYRKL